MSRHDNRVIEEFQQRRKKMLQNFVFSMILFALGILFVQIADLVPDFMGLGHRGWTAAAIAQLIAGVVFALIGFQQYRCPVCNEIVRAHDKYYLGVAIDPDSCPNCGAHLKE